MPTFELPENVKSKIHNAQNHIKVEDVIALAIKAPGVKINRTDYLTKELSIRYPKETLDIAITHNPAYAGISREDIDRIAKQAINYETNKVSAISFAAGLPGGIAMAATIPADLAQYFGFILRIMQKLAYLYGFEEFDINDDAIDDETMNRIILFLGVMFGVQEANAAIKVFASLVAKAVINRLPKMALTKGIIYPAIKKIALFLSVHMTKQIFAKGVAKIIPVVGGAASGALTYVTFKPNAISLKKQFESLPLSDPDFYKNKKNEIIDV